MSSGCIFAKWTHSAATIQMRKQMKAGSPPKPSCFLHPLPFRDNSLSLSVQATCAIFCTLYKWKHTVKTQTYNRFAYQTTFDFSHRHRTMGVSLLVQRHKSIDCKMTGKDIPCKQYPKENRSDSTNIRQNRLIKTKIVT